MNSPLGDVSVGPTTWMVLLPVGAAPLMWKLMLASTPPVVEATSFAGPELDKLISTSPGVAALGWKVHVPEGGWLVRRGPALMSAFDTVKTVGSYVSTTSAPDSPWSPA